MRTLSSEEVKRHVQKSEGAWDPWLYTLHLLANQNQIDACIRRARWEPLRGLVDFVSHGLPPGLEEHDPALFELLLKQTAQLHNSGCYARVLRALARKDGDALAGALLRGLRVRQKLANREGGSISTAQAAKLLGLSETVVLRRITHYQLLAWRDWREERLVYRLPIWQFHGKRLWPGMRRILGRFQRRHRSLKIRDDWGVMLFFLASRFSLDGKRVLDLLRTRQLDQALGYLEDEA